MSATDNPILGSPYDIPSRHWRLDDRGGIQDDVVQGRRRSESWVPVPRPRKRKVSGQTELELHRTDERRERNDQVDRIRQVVDLWRRRDYPHVTETTGRLLRYWADPERSNRVLFAQREAAETAIYIAEAAARDGNDWVRQELQRLNGEFNRGLPRVALKMATGSGKTVVMAMLIAWQTLNKVARPKDPRFSTRFLVVAPGITIRDRLRVLVPTDKGSYYAERDLVPADLWPHMRRASLTVTNFHSFLLRSTQEGRGISADTRRLVTARVDGDPFTETPPMMVARVLRGMASRRPGDGGPLVVLNDEAHHCYATAAAAVLGASRAEDLKGADKKEALARNDEAGVWFSGIRAVAERFDVKAVYDLSATPFFLSGSGYPEGYIFPWVVSDFSLLDAIESGIVKIPRVPVADDSEGDTVAYLNLWDHVGDVLPKRVAKDVRLVETRELPPTLDGALKSLYASYERAFERWEAQRREDSLRAGSTPPVIIVVCPNTLVSRWVYDTIAGWTKPVEAGGEDGPPVHVPGQLPLLSNVVDGRHLSRPRTILVDSAQLESGEALTPDFRTAAGEEIAAFRAEHVARTGRTADDLDDADLLREVLNTVGKPGRLGAGVRCVVSVSMLSEGWDANTVTHVLGVRAFGSQLLCEQVVGRGLRRRSYVVGEDGRFAPEYAEVYGVPFSFIPSDRPAADPVPGRQPQAVKAQENRSAARITFPRLDGYRVELPDHRVSADLSEVPVHRVRTEEVATLTEVAGLIGSEEVHDLGRFQRARERTVAFELAKALMRRFAVDNDPGGTRPWLFPQLVRIAEEWLRTRVEYEQSTFPGLFLIGTRRSEAAEQIYQAINQPKGGREPLVLPVFSALGRTGCTDVVDFSTTKRVIETDPEKCHVDGVVLDGPDGNTWEQIAAGALEASKDVAAYVKNDHLELAVPYLHKGAARRYLPDFVVRLTPDGSGVERHLLLEVSGGRKSQTERAEKAATARNQWCAAVNNHQGFGRWGYVEVDDPVSTKSVLAHAVERLRADEPITGLPTVLSGGLFDHDINDEELADAAAPNH
ncbi:BPTD_3080 family restriction endonuclease [Pseudokineococcus lusitanus]|uniref:Type III restriction enzyme n=1 Tax=Pseudokineococcus lusitanus TaxID=763993 RepID=A0A3N1HLD6_9ACTN|nr:DEAD/DEAH box helicase family protein [Pseudokineococcus lusitanus]ROP43269.1 type III restriction enzyme [Pseudokineococcus lusitanus]